MGQSASSEICIVERHSHASRVLSEADRMARSVGSMWQYDLFEVVNVEAS
jgi:hypothetical protein